MRGIAFAIRTGKPVYEKRGDGRGRSRLGLMKLKEATAMCDGCVREGPGTALLRGAGRVSPWLLMLLLMMFLLKLRS